MIYSAMCFLVGEGHVGEGHDGSERCCKAGEIPMKFDLKISRLFPATLLTTTTEVTGIGETSGNKGMYKKLTCYLESCESGSMFQGMNIPEIYAVSAANPTEFCYGCYCGSSANVSSCLGDLFSGNWMEDSDVKDIAAESLPLRFPASVDAQLQLRNWQVLLPRMRQTSKRQLRFATKKLLILPQKERISWKPMTFRELFGKLYGQLEDLWLPRI